MKTDEYEGSAGINRHLTPDCPSVGFLCSGHRTDYFCTWPFLCCPWASRLKGNSQLNYNDEVAGGIENWIG